MAIQFAFVVEGEGEVEAVLLLARRIAGDLDPPIALITRRPVRIPKSRLIKPGELERAAGLALATTGNSGPVLIMLDSDDDCRASLGPDLKARAAAVARGIPVAVILPKYEFESWFVGAASSLSGKRGLAGNLTEPDRPESIRGAKEWLNRHMLPGRRYSATVDQAALAQLFDSSRRSPFAIV